MAFIKRLEPAPEPPRTLTDALKPYKVTYLVWDDQDPDPEAETTA